MTTLTVENAIIRVNKLIADGYESKKIRATLVLEDYPAKVITDAMKACSVRSEPREGFKASFYGWLAEAPRSEAEAKDYLLGNGPYGETSPNIIKNTAAHMAVWKLSVSIWSGKGENVSGAPESDKQDGNSAELEKAKEALRKAKSAWAKGTPPKNKNAFHPDKVSYLGDEALTRAYTKFFQDITG